MKSITINGSKRESVGKVSTKALRNAGEVPCVVYGGDAPVHFSAPVNAFRNLVYTPDVHTVVVDLGDGTTINAILQDIQFHPVTDNILHIDFYELHDDKPVVLEIPVHLEGTPRGVKAGGVLRFNNRKLRVKAIPANLPDFIKVNIEKLRIGNKVYVRDLRNDDYQIMHPDTVVVCMVKTSRKAVAGADDDDDEEEGEEGAEETAAEATE